MCMGCGTDKDQSVRSPFTEGSMRVGYTPCSPPCRILRRTTAQHHSSCPANLLPGFLALGAWCSGMYAGEDEEVCVELGHVGKALSVSKASQPDKSKAGGWPVGDDAAEPVDEVDLQRSHILATSSEGPVVRCGWRMWLRLG